MKTVPLFHGAMLLALTGALAAQDPMAKTADTFRCRASALIGADVKNNAGENLGDIEEVVLENGSRRIAYVVISYGGFLGMGEKFFALPWGVVGFTQRGNDAKPAATLALDKDVLKKSPGFDKKKWPDFADKIWAAEVHDFYKGKYEMRPDEAIRAGAGTGDKTMTQNPKNTEFAHRRLSKLIGTNVVDPSRRGLGEIEDVIVDLQRGSVDGLVIGYGGVLGVGEKLVLAPYEALTLDTAKDVFILPITKAKLDAVAYSSGKWPTLNDNAWLDGGRDYFGKARGEKFEDGNPGETPVAYSDFYDPKTTEKITGTIITTAGVRIGDERDDRLRLRVTVDDGREVIVYAAPRNFGDQEALMLRPGKRIEITGSRAKYGSQTVLVAGTIKPADSTKVVKLRDEEGRPLWEKK